MVIREEEGILETLFITASSDAAPARPRAGKERNREQYLPKWCETIEAPNAMMLLRRWTARAAVPQWSALRTQSQLGTDEDIARKKKRERKKEIDRWTPDPHVCE